MQSSDPNGDRAAALRGIQNVAQACTYCKSRHSKCDGQVPCAQCVRRGRGNDCSYSVVRKRGPKPKKDLYEYCNKLLVELEVQKQIAEYWKDQFVMAMKGKDDGSLPALMPPGPPGLSPSASSSPTSGSAFDPNRPKFSIERVPSPDDDADDSEPMADSPTPSRADRATSPSIDLVRIKSESSSTPPPAVQMEDAPAIDITIAAEIAYCFLDVMLPVIPELTFVPSAICMCEAYQSNRAQFESVPMENYHHLVALLESAVIGAYGSRTSGHAGHMRHFAKKAEELMHVLFFQREVQTRADVANRLVGALVLLSSYYAGDEREGSKQSVIMLAYQIVSLHRKQIPPAAMFRIYTVMMGLADTQEDRVYWNEQCNAVVREGSMDLVTAQTFSNLSYVLSTLHPKLSWGKPYPPVSPSEISSMLEKILMVDHFLTMIPSPREPTRMRNFYDAAATIKLMYIGARVEIHFLRGEYDYAKRLIYAAAILASTFHRPAIYTFMYGASGPIEVAMHLNMPINLLREWYIMLDRVKDVMPGAMRLFGQVTDYLQRNDPQANRFFASSASLRQTVSEEQRIERNDKVHSLLQQCPVAVQNLSPAFLTHKSALEMFRPRLPGLVDATVIAMEHLRRRISDEVASVQSGRTQVMPMPQVMPAPVVSQLPPMMMAMQPVPQHMMQQQQYLDMSQQHQNMFIQPPTMFAQSPFGYDPVASPTFHHTSFSGDMTSSPGMPSSPQVLSPPLTLPPQSQYGYAQPGQVDIENFFNSTVVSSEYDM